MGSFSMSSGIQQSKKYVLCHKGMCGLVTGDGNICQHMQCQDLRGRGFLTQPHSVTDTDGRAETGSTYSDQQTLTLFLHDCRNMEGVRGHCQAKESTKTVCGFPLFFIPIMTTKNASKHSQIFLGNGRDLKEISC